MLAGCAGSQAASAERASFLNTAELAQTLVQRDWDLFAGFQRAAFSERISGDFLTDKYAFLNEAEASFYEAVPMGLSFTVDKALMKNNKFAVTFTWQRKIADRNTGDLILKEGRGTIVYCEENGQWLIYKIQGNSIFTF
jgi:hypothetical protein